jgi:hypothetical protein
MLIIDFKRPNDVTIGDFYLLPLIRDSVSMVKDQNESFETIIYILHNGPLLQYPDFERFYSDV